MKTLQEIAAEQGIETVTEVNIDDILLNTEERGALVSKRQMGAIMMYFLHNLKDFYPKEFVAEVCTEGWIEELYGVSFYKMYNIRYNNQDGA